MLARLMIPGLIAATLALQPVSAHAQTGNGFFHSGKYIGFVPAHLRHEENLEQQIVGDATTEQRSENETAEEASLPIVPIAFEVVEGKPLQVPDASYVVTPSIGSGYCQIPRFWGRADYLVWWTSEMDAPSLATTGPAAPPNQVGVLGQPGTTTLFGGELLDGERSGGRFTLGFWLDDCRRRGIDVSYLQLSNESESFSASQNEFPVLARPFFNTQTSAQDARRIALAGEVQGILSVQASTEFQALEVLYRSASDCFPCQRAEFLFGYRFAELDERLGISESTLALGGAAPGAMIDLTDRFEAENEFHGGELGVRLEGAAADCFAWELLAKVAVGNTRSRARVSGQTTTTAAGATAMTSAGLLAQATNSGAFEQDEFSAIWELGITLRRELACGFTGRLGYTLLLWQDVSRVGNQIDTTINPSQIPPGALVGEPRPGFAFQTSDFWAHGLNFGLEYVY